MARPEKVRSIRQLMEAADKRPVDLAQEMEVTPQAVSQWVSGTSHPSPDRLTPLAVSLGVSVEDLLKGLAAAKAAKTAKPARAA